jgi:hypothetical protein
MAERTVRVRMREGLIMPLPSEIVRNSSTFICTPETPIEVLLDHRFTRKRLESGDFEIVGDDPAQLGLPESRRAAAAPPVDDEPEPVTEERGSLFSRKE